MIRTQGLEVIRFSGLEVTGDRCTGDHKDRPYGQGFLVANLVFARHNAQTPFPTLESRGIGRSGEASLTPTVETYSRGAHGFTR